MLRKLEKIEKRQQKILDSARLQLKWFNAQVAYEPHKVSLTLNELFELT